MMETRLSNNESFKRRRYLRKRTEMTRLVEQENIPPVLPVQKRQLRELQVVSKIPGQIYHVDQAKQIDISTKPIEFVPDECISDWTSLTSEVILSIALNTGDSHIFTLCPEAIFLLETNSVNNSLKPIIIRTSKILIRCGDDGALENKCLIVGGRSHFKISGSVKDVSFEGITFAGSKGTPILATGDANSKVEFKNCAFLDNTGEAAMLVYNEKKGILLDASGAFSISGLVAPKAPSMSVTCTGCVFAENKVKDGTVMNLGGKITFMRSVFIANNGIAGVITSSHDGDVSIEESCFIKNTIAVAGVVIVDEGGHLTTNKDNFGDGNKVDFGMCDAILLEVGPSCIGEDNTECIGLCATFISKKCKVNLDGISAITDRLDELYPKINGKPGGGKNKGGGAKNMTGKEVGTIIGAVIGGVILLACFLSGSYRCGQKSVLKKYQALPSHDNQNSSSGGARRNSGGRNSANGGNRTPDPSHRRRPRPQREDDFEDAPRVGDQDARRKKPNGDVPAAIPVPPIDPIPVLAVSLYPPALSGGEHNKGTNRKSIRKRESSDLLLVGDEIEKIDQSGHLMDNDHAATGTAKFFKSGSMLSEMAAMLDAAVKKSNGRKDDSNDDGNDELKMKYNRASNENDDGDDDSLRASISKKKKKNKKKDTSDGEDSGSMMASLRSVRKKKKKADSDDDDDSVKGLHRKSAKKSRKKNESEDDDSDEDIENTRKKKKKKSKDDSDDDDDIDLSRRKKKKKSKDDSDDDDEDIENTRKKKKKSKDDSDDDDDIDLSRRKKKKKSKDNDEDNDDIDLSRRKKKKKSKDNSDDDDDDDIDASRKKKKSKDDSDDDDDIDLSQRKKKKKKKDKNEEPEEKKSKINDSTKEKKRNENEGRSSEDDSGLRKPKSTKKKSQEEVDNSKTEGRKLTRMSIDSTATEDFKINAKTGDDRKRRQKSMDSSVTGISKMSSNGDTTDSSSDKLSKRGSLDSTAVSDNKSKRHSLDSSVASDYKTKRDSFDSAAINEQKTKRGSLDSSSGDLKCKKGSLDSTAVHDHKSKKKTSDNATEDSKKKSKRASLDSLASSVLQSSDSELPRRLSMQSMLSTESKLSTESSGTRRSSIAGAGVSDSETSFASSAAASRSSSIGADKTNRKRSVERSASATRRCSLDVINEKRVTKEKSKRNIPISEKEDGGGYKSSTSESKNREAEKTHKSVRKEKTEKEKSSSRSKKSKQPEVDTSCTDEEGAAKKGSRKGKDKDSDKDNDKNRDKDNRKSVSNRDRSKNTPRSKKSSSDTEDTKKSNDKSERSLKKKSKDSKEKDNSDVDESSRKSKDKSKVKDREKDKKRSQMREGIKGKDPLRSSRKHDFANQSLRSCAARTPHGLRGSIQRRHTPINQSSLRAFNLPSKKEKKNKKEKKKDDD